MATLDNDDLEALAQKLREERQQETTAHPGPFGEAGGGAKGIDANLQRTLAIMKPIAASGAAPEVMLITMTVAALMPVIQANMGFVLASANLYRQSHTENAAMNANAIPLVAESAHRIMAPRADGVAAAASTRRVDYAVRNLNELAVT